MYLPRITSSFIALLLVISAPFCFSQEERTVVSSPYRTEYNPWFKFGVFKRGYKNEALTAKLDSLESKPRKNWSRKDSLTFAEVSKKTGNFELSAYYFDKLRIDYHTEEKYWWERLTLHFLQHEYNSCLDMIRDAEPGLVEFSKLWFFKKICDAKLRSLKDEKWFKKESVLSWEVDSTTMNMDRESPLYHERIIAPLENIRFVLELLIRQIHDNDEVIARTCLEVGRITHAYVSATEAFIILNIGRNYDKWDDDIQDAIQVAKADLIRHHYRIPVFRENFPRIEPWRFDYELLKEKIIYERNDTLAKTPPQLYKKPEKELIHFNAQLAILAGIGLMFICLIAFLRTRKK